MKIDLEMIEVLEFEIAESSNDSTNNIILKESKKKYRQSFRLLLFLPNADVLDF